MRLTALIAFLGLCWSFLPATLQAQALPRYFPQTQQRLDDRAGFLSEWLNGEGALTLGMPISPQLTVNDRVQQYFERGRLEQTADGQVVRAAVGVEYLQLLGQPFVTGGPALPIAAEFAAFYRLHGAAGRFGAALTAADWQYRDDELRLVQYFARARLELSAGGSVAIGALGSELLQLQGLSFAADSGRGAAATAADGSAWQAAGRRDGDGKRIIVDLSDQWLYALDGGQLVFDSPVTTGRPGWETPVGEHRVYYKLPLQTMDACAQGECWTVPDVPNVMYIYGGVALHGAYWHNAFGSGRLLSHGCINLPLRSAAWLYRWTPYNTPVTVRP
jgi:hypothetical protein